MVRFTQIRLNSSVDFATRNNARVVTLNRPKALNALNHAMVKAMRPQLAAWSAESGFSCAIIKGAGEKAFCAGGDIKDLTLPTYEGDYSGTFFFREEYQLDYQIATYSHPFVALMNGVVMGGGVGLSIHAPIRIGNERTLFAMPETGIGLFPDVGAGHFLSRVKQPGLGMYLGLTGERLKGVNNKHAGVITHYVDSARMDEIEAELSQLAPGTTTGEIDAFVKQFETSNPGDFALQDQLAQIEHYFANKQSIGHVIVELEAASSDEWAAKVAKKLRRMSPMSLAITHEQIKRAASMDLAEVFAMEYRLAYSCIRHEFAEGVRALLIDRDNAPKWTPSRIEDVTSEQLDAFFAEKPHAWHPTE